MKNILIPTDFSPNALFAVNFGAELAANMNASITLLHAFDIPIFADQLYFENETIANWEKDFNKLLHDIAGEIHKKHAGLLINTISRFGQAADVIAEQATGYDLIVMGSKGHGNIGDAIFGNVTSDVVRRIKKNILVIPPDVVFTPVKNIVLACHKESLISNRIVSNIQDFADSFGARLNLLNVVTEVAGPVTAAYAEIEKIKDHFPGIETSTNVIAANKVVDGINEFSDQIKANLVVIVPDKHSLFERIFTEIHTTHMVKVAHRALLIIPKG